MMTDKMQALVKTQKGQGFVELREVPVPSIGATDVLIEVKAAAVCGTDLHIYNDRFPYWPPVTMGHEFSGVISAVGEDVSNWRVGDRVVGEPHTLACGSCYLCRTGNPQICPDKRSPGWGIDGAFARYMRWPNPHLLHVIPDSLSFEAAALVEPFANVVSDLVLPAAITAGDLVVVMGPGPIGIMAAVMAHEMSAGQVIMVGTDADEGTRLKLCRELPQISHVVNVQKDDLHSLVNDLSGKGGADVIVEASGAAPAISMAAQLARKQAKVIAIGLTGTEKIEFPYDMFMTKDIDLSFNISTKYDSWDRTINLLDRGVLPVGQIVTHKSNLDGWEEVFKNLLNRTGIKGLFIYG